MPSFPTCLLVVASGLALVEGSGFVRLQKVIGFGAVNGASLGRSLALSFDGSTLIVGGPTDGVPTDSRTWLAGATWAFARSTASSKPYTQIGHKLVGQPHNDYSGQGASVAVSNDGSTIVTGGPGDEGPGGVWVFTRHNGTYTQQTPTQLNGPLGTNDLGRAVALSGDGNTLAAGGWTEGDRQMGGAWIWTRSQGVWTPVRKLLGTDPAGWLFRGFALALSQKGDTLAMASAVSSTHNGGVWVFVRVGTTWQQQGPKLVGLGGMAPYEQVLFSPCAVDLSADGNTLAMGAPGDHGGVGATWVFVRVAGKWYQQGGKLVGSGAPNPPAFGSSVSLSASGNLLAVGGPGPFVYPGGNKTYPGATWLFQRDATGKWAQLGSKISATDSTPGVDGKYQGISVSLAGNGKVLAIGDNYVLPNGAAYLFGCASCA